MKSLSRLTFSLAVIAAGLGVSAPASAQGFYDDNRAAGLPVTPFRRSDRECAVRAFECAVDAWHEEGSEAGLRRFRQAAGQGSTPAMRALGLIYRDGAGGIGADKGQALGWFYEAALRGDGESMFALARAFGQGEGVAADPALARYWLERSADTGYRPAARALGR